MVGVVARPESPPKTDLGFRLREVRRRLGDTPRAEFAKSLGFGKDSLALYERGENVPTAHVLAAYREKLGIDVNWLLTGAGEMFADPSKAPASAAPSINPALFRKVGRLVTRVHKEEGIKLPPDAVLDEQADAYNALLARAEDPSDADELMALLTWLETRLKKRLRAATEEPGTGKQQA
ncbi:helix-turn-helix domain-containing protein [Stappia stellulata]|uniref:helix-turn-helix domain-containing protein n=1 Tax=Stappia stellulata TaxID=71235 RepID=UPI001AD912E5|nr:helix-turn-helix transcriptional regulator [Stappia stellulata]